MSTNSLPRPDGSPCIDIPLPSHHQRSLNCERTAWWRRLLGTCWRAARAPPPTPSTSPASSAAAAPPPSARSAERPSQRYLERTSAKRYMVYHLVWDLDWVGFDLDVPPCCLPAQPILPNSSPPKQNWADSETKKNSQPRSQTRWLIHKHCLVKSPLDARDKKVSQRAQKSLRLATKCLNSETYGGAGYRSRYLSHAKRALYHLSYAPELRTLVKC